MGSTGRTATPRAGGAGTVAATGAAQAQAQGQILPTDTPQIVATQQQAQTANNANFSATDDGDYRDLEGKLRDYYGNQTFNIDTQVAIQDYLYDKPTGGSLYSPSQEMNYKMKHEGEKGISPLTPQETFMRDSMLEGMHNLGQNMILEHYGRISYVDAFGQLAKQMGLTNQNITSNNFGNMSESALKKAFTGVTYDEKGFVSTSVNHFAKAPAGNAFTDKAVKITIKAPASAQGLMPGNGPGGALGEMVLAPNQHYRITDVKFTGKNGRSGASTYKQIEFIVEMY